MNPVQLWGLFSSLRSLIGSIANIERDEPRIGKGIHIAIVALLVAFLVVPLIRRPRAKKTGAE